MLARPQPWLKAERQRGLARARSFRAPALGEKEASPNGGCTNGRPLGVASPHELEDRDQRMRGSKRSGTAALGGRQPRVVFLERETGLEPATLCPEGASSRAPLRPLPQRHTVPQPLQPLDSGVSSRFLSNGSRARSPGRSPGSRTVRAPAPPGPRWRSCGPGPS